MPSKGDPIMNPLSPKIEPRHLRLRAIVYVRQSTPRQVQHNQESTRRQYQLAERAQQMGWAAPQIEVIDEDLGLSGASSHARAGFQRLVAAIGLGEVGLVLVTEVSRLSRRNRGHSVGCQIDNAVGERFANLDQAAALGRRTLSCRRRSAVA